MTKLLLQFKKNKFLSNSLLYVVGSMMTPAIGLIMIPIYTNFFFTEEYGMMTTVQTLAGMFQLLLLLSLHGAITRFYYDFMKNKKEQKLYLGSIILFVLIYSSISSVLLLILYKPIGAILFSEIPIKPYYFFLIGLAWVNALLALPLALWRAQERAGTFVLFNLIKTLFIMLISSYLIIVKGYGVGGVLSTNLVISFIFICIAFIMTRDSYTLNLNNNYIKASLFFSLPLLPHVASGWIIQSSDRIILEKFVGLGELGLYSLAAQVAMVMSLFYTAVNNALVPRYTLLRKDGRNTQASKILKTFFVIIIVSGIVSIPISISAVKVLTSSEYNNAITFIPILIIGEIIKGFYFIPVARLFYAKRTKAIATSSIIAAITNILFNLLLIPLLGVFGAAIATIIAELVRLLLIYSASKKTQ